MITPLRSIWAGAGAAGAGAAGAGLACCAPTPGEPATAAVRVSKATNRTGIPTIASPRKGKARASADAAVLEAGANASIEHDVVVETVLGRERSGILTRESAPVRRNRKLLVRRQRPAA